MTQKVYVSLTTISERIKSVHDTVSSILSQDYHVDRVTLYISKEPFIIDKGIKEIDLKYHHTIRFKDKLICLIIKN